MGTRVKGGRLCPINFLRGYLMKSTLFTAAALAAAASLAACNQAENPGQTEPVNMAQDVAGAATGLAAGARGAVDTDAFLTNAAIGDMYEIESSRLALERSQSAQVKKAAETIIKDHEAASAKLKAIAAGMGKTLPTEMDERRKGMMDNLRAADASSFDDRYLDQQTAAHHEAITMFKGYREMGADATLKAFAAEVTPRLEHHVELVGSLDRESPADDTAPAQ